MGTEHAPGEDVDQETEAELTASLEDAFSAGFESKDYVMPEEAGQETPSTSVSEESQSTVADEAGDPPANEAGDPPANEAGDPPANEAGDPPANEAGDPPVNEWEGVPDAVKTRFEKMALELDRVTNIANSASGRANKLQSEVQRAGNNPQQTPKPTSQQIHEAMVDKGKRDALRTDFPDFAAAFDELDSTISNAVGSQIDLLRNEFAQTQQQTVEDQVKYALDMRHPGWQDTVQDENFKEWVYEGGPSSDERVKYENMLGYAQSLSNNSPSESQALFSQANNLYVDMLTRYPTWASDRGSLFGDPSGTAAIKLLDMHKAVQLQRSQTTSNVDDQHVAQQARNKKRLAANVAPTSGAAKQVAVDKAEDINAAFEEGFNSRGY